MTEPSSPLPAAPPPAAVASPPPTRERAVSPRWSIITKFMVSLVFLFLLGGLLDRFRSMIGPLVLAVMLAYLLRPGVENLVARTRFSWGAAVAIVYLVLVAVLIMVVTVAGIALVQQIQDLYGALVGLASSDLPARLQTILSEPITLGPFTVDLDEPFRIGPFGPFRIDLASGSPVYNEAINAIQPALSRAGDVVTALASGTAETLGWIVFILIVSFYLLTDLHTIRVSFEGLVPEGYEYDAQRLVGALGPIWNAFLRGQLTLALVMGLVVGIVMAVLGVRYAPGLGLLAGLLEFIPIIGPVIAGTVAVMVALFQPTNWLGLSPVAYAGLVLLASIVVQQIENNFLVPRILGSSLNLHPVVVLVGALIAANLAGIIGLLLSTPVLATLRLVGAYVYRKMFDLDPWPEPQPMVRASPERKWGRWLRRRLTTVLARRPRAGGEDEGRDDHP